MSNDVNNSNVIIKCV